MGKDATKRCNVSIFVHRFIIIKHTYCITNIYLVWKYARIYFIHVLHISDI